MRVKLVISSTIEGATERSVITITIWIATLTSPVCPWPSRPMFRRKGALALPEPAVVAGPGAELVAAAVAGIGGVMMVPGAVCAARKLGRNSAIQRPNLNTSDRAVLMRAHPHP